MKRICRFVIFVVLMFGISIGYCQDDDDHLEPVNSIFGIYDFEFEYDIKVRKILFKGLTDTPEIRFQAMPSFTPESVLDIEFDSEKDKYFLIFHVCKRMIWYAKKWKKIKVRKYKIEIEGESAELIKSLFDIAISQVKFSKAENIGLDGANYYFSIYKFGLRTGTVWSPPNGSKLRNLVDVGYKLIELAKSKESPVRIDNEFRLKIESLIKVFNDSEIEK